ncbi:unnamed protein product [Effrenium voratum]|nr:unnamed protein product [Effrenium voratum]
MARVPTWVMLCLPVAFLGPRTPQAASEACIPRDWEVEVRLDSGQLSSKTMLAAAEALNATGFAVLRGSIFSEKDLDEAQAVAEAELERVKDAAARLNLLGRAPWLRGSYSAGKLFEFQEALCYSEGRLDMPGLLEHPLLSAWRGHPGLRGVAERCFGRGCEQTVLGALWNFPGSGPPVWHRDGDADLLVAVTAARDYPEAVGFIHGQPKSHRIASNSAAPPNPELGEVDVPLPLRRGDTLLFYYSTKHAATPNLSNLDRCLLYGVYGPQGTRDHHYQQKKQLIWMFSTVVRATLPHGQVFSLSRSCPPCRPWQP